MTNEVLPLISAKTGSDTFGHFKCVHAQSVSGKFFHASKHFEMTLMEPEKINCLLLLEVSVHFEWGLFGSAKFALEGF